jgi:hypothetical protein
VLPLELANDEKEDSRFLSTDGTLIPVLTRAEVFLFGTQNLLKGADIWA